MFFTDASLELHDGFFDLWCAKRIGKFQAKGRHNLVGREMDGDHTIRAFNAWLIFSEQKDRIVGRFAGPLANQQPFALPRKKGCCNRQNRTNKNRGGAINCRYSKTIGRPNPGCCDRTPAPSANSKSATMKLQK